MTSPAQARRSSWLRRTRLATTWIAAAAAAATLLIAVAVGSASPSKRAVAPSRSASRQRPAAVLARTVPLHRKRARAHVRAAVRQKATVAHAAPAVRPAPPAPAPPVAPVAVSGGS
jgi:hypothetical protein